MLTVEQGKDRAGRVICYVIIKVKQKENNEDDEQ